MLKLEAVPGLSPLQLCPTSAQQPTLQTLISHWLKKPCFEGGSSFLLWGGGSLKEYPTFPPVCAQKKPFLLRFGPKFRPPTLRPTCHICNLATFTLQGPLEKSRYRNSVSTPHRRYGHRFRTLLSRNLFPTLLLLPNAETQK